jgi:hypothetical protein
LPFRQKGRDQVDFSDFEGFFFFAFFWVHTPPFE